jgi:hypothetical protein
VLWILSTHTLHPSCPEELPPNLNFATPPPKEKRKKKKKTKQKKDSTLLRDNVTGLEPVLSGPRPCSLYPSDLSSTTATIPKQTVFKRSYLDEGPNDFAYPCLDRILIRSKTLANMPRNYDQDGDWLSRGGLKRRRRDPERTHLGVFSNDDEPNLPKDFSNVLANWKRILLDFQSIISYPNWIRTASGLRWLHGRQLLISATMEFSEQDLLAVVNFMANGILRGRLSNLSDHGPPWFEVSKKLLRKQFARHRTSVPIMYGIVSHYCSRTHGPTAKYIPTGFYIFYWWGILPRVRHDGGTSFLKI